MREGPKRGARRLGDLLSEVVKASVGPRRREKADLSLAWSRAAGAQVARHSRPVGFRGGSLVVRFDSATLRHEVECFRKGEILERLGEEYPKRRIANLKCILNG